jgi:hypothetical protein
MIPPPAALRRRRNGSLEVGVRPAREPRPAIAGYPNRLQAADRQVVG